MAQAPSTPEDFIDRVRAASNAALMAGDVEAFMASIDVDYVGTAGNGGHIRDRTALQEMIRDLFANSPGHHFVRTPSEIEVDSGGRRAIEMGAWVEVPAGQTAATSTGVRGRYTAYWRRVAARWVIHAEVFVTLGSG
jgi:ketosteroid isomerase-like protein